MILPKGVIYSNCPDCRNITCTCSKIYGGNRKKHKGIRLEEEIRFEKLANYHSKDKK